MVYHSECHAQLWVDQPIGDKMSGIDWKALAKHYGVDIGDSL